MVSCDFQLSAFVGLMRSDILTVMSADHGNRVRRTLAPSLVGTYHRSWCRRCRLVRHFSPRLVATILMLPQPIRIDCLRRYWIFYGR